MTPNDSGNGASNAMQRKGCNAVCNTVTNARETLAIPSPTPPALPPQPYPPQCRYSPVHHGVQLVTRDSAPVVAPSPVTTPDAMMSLTAIEHLDFEPERECEHPQHPLGEMGHSGPAWALVEVIHLCASPSRTLVYVCRGGWDEAGARGTHCQRCGENLTRDQSWRIVQVLR